MAAGTSPWPPGVVARVAGGGQVGSAAGDLGGGGDRGRTLAVTSGIIHSTALPAWPASKATCIRGMHKHLRETESEQGGESGEPHAPGTGHRHWRRTAARYLLPQQRQVGGVLP